VPRLTLLVGVFVISLLLIANTAQAENAFTISGAVKAQRTGLGVEGTEVKVTESTGGRQVGAATTGVGGEYEVPGVTTGTYNIEFVPPLGSGYESFTARDEAVSANLTLDVSLVSAAVSVSGVLRDSAGEVLPEADVDFYTSAAGYSGETAANGSFTTLAMPLGTYKWQVTGYRPAGVPHTVLPRRYFVEGAGFEAGGGQPEEIELPALHTLTVRAVGPDGDPVAGVKLYSQYTGGELAHKLPVAPGMEADAVALEEEETTNEEGEASLVLPDWRSAEATVHVDPPSDTQLPDTSFEVGGITENQTRLVAFGKSGTDTTPPEIKCASPEPGWHGENVAIPCTASDSGSGLELPSLGRELRVLAERYAGARSPNWPELLPSD
jgi:hypothetical protein